MLEIWRDGEALEQNTDTPLSYENLKLLWDIVIYLLIINTFVSRKLLLQSAAY